MTCQEYCNVLFGRYELIVHLQGTSDFLVIDDAVDRGAPFGVSACESRSTSADRTGQSRRRLQKVNTTTNQDGKDNFGTIMI